MFMSAHSPLFQDQLKTYDKDILQELWKIRTTVQTLREADRKPRKEESRFLDDTIEDRSPTPGSQQEEAEDHSLPSSPSPPPTYLAVDGNRYGERTLNLMATAPSHLQKSSDVLVLEEFFGTEQLTKFDMFKKQVSCDNLSMGTKDARSDGLPLIAEEGLRPGVSMPNISHTPPSSSSLLSYPETRDKGGQVKLRLAKNPRLSDANRMSYDIASEMEQLRARLQETAKQELADFDRKYSPKLHHSNVMSADNHSRQGSLDSSIPNQQATTPTLAALKGGHSRQHSLPIDPKFLRQLQNQQSNETTPSLATAHKSGQSPSLGPRHMSMDRGQSPPLLFGHIRQVSGGSMSSEGGAFSPPLTPTEGHAAQNSMGSSSFRPPGRFSTGAGAGLPVQHLKQGNPPGMARIASDGAYNRRAYGSNNSLSRTSPEGEGNGNGNGGSRGRTSSTTAPHYSTSVIKRGGKRGSLEIAPPPSMQHPQYGGGGGMYKYEEKVPNGRPNAYEQPKRRSYGEDMMETGNHTRVGNGGVGRFAPVSSPPRMEGGIPASPRLTRALDRRGSSDSRQQPSTVTTAATNPYSRLHTRASEPTNLRGSGKPPNNPATGRTHEEIEPYMTSKHVKSQMQMQNFNYTPFSQHQQRSYTVSGGDAPKLTKQAKSSKNTWI